MIDSHCHLADTKFKDDLDGVLLRAEENGVEVMVSIGDTIQESKECLILAEKYDQLFCTAGVHPHCAKDWDEGSGLELEKIKDASDKVVAIGEIGLDYHYDHSPRDVQRTVFAEQLLLANGWGMPVVVHCREAIDDVRSIVWDSAPSKLVMHCCCEKWEDVADFVERGYMLSFTGIATYPKSEDIRRTIKECPLEQLMVETDAPYLAPQDVRGQRCEPAHVMEVAKLIADLKSLTLAEVDAQTTKNTVEFYSLPT